MSSWAITLTVNGVAYDITSYVDVPSIKRTLSLHSKLKATTNKCELEMLYDAAIWALFMVYKRHFILITKDGAPYFTGVISPNFSHTIKPGKKTIKLTAEDYSLSLLKQTITTTIALNNYYVCSTSHPLQSILHYLATLAGVTLASDLPDMPQTVPLLVVLADDKKTIKDILEAVLYEFCKVPYFYADGTLTIVDAINMGDITTSSALDASNIRGEPELKKSPEAYDDIRITYDSLELKSGITVFKDASGATGSLDCNIELAATGDASGKDYYPTNSGATEVYSEWSSPDGYEIKSVVSCELDTKVGSGITLSRTLTNYYKRASFAYHNPGAASAYITRLRIKGDAWVKTAQNTVRATQAGATELLEMTCDYVGELTNAQALAQALSQYYAHSDLEAEVASFDDVPVGAYVSFSDTIYSGVSFKARVVGRVDSNKPGKATVYNLEAVADFAAVAIVSTATVAQIAGDAAAQIEVMADDGYITPQEKASLLMTWNAINGDGSSTGTYWGARSAAIAASVSTDVIDHARDALNGQLYGSPGVLLAATWAKNVAINSATFYAAWTDYYSAETATKNTITKYAAYGSVSLIDCGLYADGVAADVADELDGGEYVVAAGIADLDTSVDYDGATCDQVQTSVTLGGGGQAGIFPMTISPLDGTVYKWLRLTMRALWYYYPTQDSDEIRIYNINGPGLGIYSFPYKKQIPNLTFVIDIDLSLAPDWQQTITSFYLAGANGYYQIDSIVALTALTPDVLLDTGDYDSPASVDAGAFDCGEYSEDAGYYILPDLVLDCETY